MAERSTTPRQFAVVTGASSGIGYELAAIANVTPAGVLAEQHPKMAEPGSGTKRQKS